jgi:hypothetical protein
MIISYTPTLEDYKAVYRLHHIQRLGGRRSYTFFFVIFPVLASLGFIFFIVMDLCGFTGFENEFSGTIIFLFLCLFSFFLIYRRSYIIRKQYRRYIHQFPPSRSDRAKIIDIDDERIISEITEISVITFFWTAVAAYAQDDEILLIYVRCHGYILFPIRVMSQAQRTELNEIIARHVVKRKP